MTFQCNSHHQSSGRSCGNQRSEVIWLWQPMPSEAVDGWNTEHRTITFACQKNIITSHEIKMRHTGKTTTQHRKICRILQILVNEWSSSFSSEASFFSSVFACEQKKGNRIIHSRSIFPHHQGPFFPLLWLLHRLTKSHIYCYATLLVAIDGPATLELPVGLVVHILAATLFVF